MPKACFPGVRSKLFCRALCLEVQIEKLGERQIAATFRALVEKQWDRIEGGAVRHRDGAGCFHCEAVGLRVISGGFPASAAVGVPGGRRRIAARLATLDKNVASVTAAALADREVVGKRGRHVSKGSTLALAVPGPARPAR